MALDLYSICPGGRGKKIQFCCPERLKDLEQIDKMLEGEQYAAGLSFVESLEAQHPDCACLMEAKGLFQRLIGLWEDAYETAVKFVGLEPKNVVALTELATTSALLGKSKESINALIDAVENIEGDQFPTAVIQAMLTVGLTFYETGHIFTAIAIAKQLQAFSPTDPTLNNFLYRCLGSNSVPLMLKELVFDLEAPGDFPRRQDYAEAVNLLSHGQWKRGRVLLESMLSDGEQWPYLFRSLGIVELWFADEEKAQAYFDRFLSDEKVDYESKVDICQLKLLLRTPTWDDVLYMEKRVYTINNFDEAFERILSSRNLLVNPRLQVMRAGETPPKQSFSLLDKPLCDKTVDLTLDDVSQQIGYLLVYGKQTTRPARIEIYAFPSDFSAVKSILAQILTELPPCEEKETIEKRAALWTVTTSTPRFVFKDPSKLTPEAVGKLNDDFLNSFVETWFSHKYEAFDGKSPSELLNEGAKAKVDAMIRIVASTFASSYSAMVEKLLRNKCNIPFPEEIVPPASFDSPSEASDYYHRLPLWRWGRLQLQKCRTEDLIDLLQVASLVATQDVKEKFASEILKREDTKVQYQDKASALSILIDASILDNDTDRALELIAQGASIAKSVGQSDGYWKALEAITRFRRQEMDKVRSLAHQVFTEYSDDKEAVQLLRQFFEEVNASAQAQLQAAEAYRRQAGQMPSATMNVNASSHDASLDFGVVPQSTSQTRDEKGGLWTPGGNEQGGGKGTSKLWIPD